MSVICLQCQRDINEPPGADCSAAHAQNYTWDVWRLHHGKRQHRGTLTTETALANDARLAACRAWGNAIYAVRLVPPAPLQAMDLPAPPFRTFEQETVNEPLWIKIALAASILLAVIMSAILATNTQDAAITTDSPLDAAPDPGH